MLNKGVNINVQEIVESPELYILGKTNDSLAEKLSYTETRLEDLTNLKPLSINRKVFDDELRFFIGTIYLSFNFFPNSKEIIHCKCNKQCLFIFRRPSRNTERNWE